MSDYTILLIDYDPRSIGQITTALENAGYRVELAKDGKAGLKAFDRVKPDLTLVEAMIPKLHGFEVCQRLKRTEHGGGTPVVIITAVYKGRKYRSEARHLYQADEFLEKPIADDELIAAVRAILARGAFRRHKAAAAAAVGGKAQSMSAPATVLPPEEAEILDRLDSVLGDDPRSATPKRTRSPQDPEPEA